MSQGSDGAIENNRWDSIETRAPDGEMAPGPDRLPSVAVGDHAERRAVTPASEYALDALRSDGDFVLYRGRDRALPASRAPWVLAVAPAREHPAPELLLRLEREYSLRAELDAAWAVRPVLLTRNEDRTTLILEDPGGEPLDRLLGKPIEPGQFLWIAISLCAAVRQVHARGLIHKDIKPANVL